MFKKILSLMLCLMLCISCLPMTAMAEEAAEPAVEDEIPVETEDVTPVPEAEDETPATEAEDETPATETEDVTPAPEVEDETPATETEDVTPAPETEDETPVPEAEDETPVPKAEDETPAAETEGETPDTDTEAEDELSEAPMMFSLRSSAADTEPRIELVNGYPAEVNELGYLLVNEANFPDPVFRQYIMDCIDSGKWNLACTGQDSGYWLSEEEASSFTGFDIRDMAVTDITGLEYFQGLTFFQCHGSQLTSIDLTKNPNIETLSMNLNMNLTSINLSNSTALRDLRVNSNALTALDLSAATNLEHVDCFQNQLTSLDVSGNTKLAHLNCAENQINALNTGSLTSLLRLISSRNAMSSVDVSNNPNLTDLIVDRNQISALDLLKNLALKVLCFNANQISSIDVSQQKDLHELQANGNRLSEIDLSQNTSLACLELAFNNLPSIDLSANSSIDEQARLWLSNQRITTSATKKGSVCTLDMASIVGKENLDKVSISSGGSYDPATGLLTLDVGADAEITEFSYSYNTGSSNSNLLDVIARVTLIEAPVPSAPTAPAPPAAPAEPLLPAEPEDIFDEAINESKGSGSDEVVVQLSPAEDESITLPADKIKDIVDEAKGLTIDTPSASVSFDKTALESLGQQSGSVSLQFRELKEAKLTTSQKKAIRNSLDNKKGETHVFTFTLDLICEGQSISDLGGGSMTVKMPYTPKEGEEGDSFVVFYLNAQGEIVRTNALYENGMLIIKLEQL